MTKIQKVNDKLVIFSKSTFSLLRTLLDTSSWFNYSSSNNLSKQIKKIAQERENKHIMILKPNG